MPWVVEFARIVRGIVLYFVSDIPNERETEEEEPEYRTLYW